MDRDRLYTLLIRTFVYVFSINAFSYIYADVDLWGHIKFGQEILSNHALHLVNTYSYTAPEHPWINHELLAEIIFAYIYSNAGSTGLLIFRLMLGLAIIHILSSLYFEKARNRLAYAIHFLLLAPVLVTGFATRPQIFTYLFLTLLVLILQKYFSGSNKAIYWAPPLMLVWVNTHGGVVAGFFIFATVVGVEVARRLVTRDGPVKPLIFSLFLSGAVLFANPYGYKLWLFFLETIPRSRPIGEWGPVSLLDSTYLCFKILVLLFVVTLFLPGKKRLWEVVMISLAVVYGFKHGRHTVITAILMTPYLPLRLAALFEAAALKRWIPKISSAGHALILSVLAGGILLQTHFHLFKYRGVNFQVQVDPVVFPIHAVRFLAANKIDGNILVLFDWGEYVIWKRPASKVSMDGRLWTAYPDKVFRDNILLAEGGPGWEEVLERYPHEIILMNKQNRGLEGAKNWQKIYEDPIARVFIRNTEPASPYLEKFQRKELIYPEEPISWAFP